MPTITDRVAASDDDCGSYPTGQFSTILTSQYLGNDGDWNHSGLRFTLNVPNGATITSATLTFTALLNLSADTVRVKIHYEDANDPADFSGDNYTTFEARVRSAIAYDWDFTTNWSVGETYETPNIATVIQALVNEAYWATSEHVVILIDDDSSTANAYRRAMSYDEDPTKAALLTVIYTLPEKGFSAIF